MTSHSSQDTLKVGPLCLPLAKFSYATVSDDKLRPIPWTHLSSKSHLFAVFETTRTQNSQGHITDQRIFKVMQDPNIMVALPMTSVGISDSMTNLQDFSRRILTLISLPLLHMRQEKALVIRYLQIQLCKWLLWSDHPSLPFDTSEMTARYPRLVVRFGRKADIGQGPKISS